jgi:uncharacterized repeat protein (TIGR03803 family)
MEVAARIFLRRDISRQVCFLFIACGGLWIAPVAVAQVTEQILKAFPAEAGDIPRGLIQGIDGVLYGAVRNGGCSNSGALFSITTNGLGFRLLHTFGRFNGDGRYPTVGLLQGQDGALYGTTSGGGVSGAGTVYRMDTNGDK